MPRILIADDNSNIQRMASLALKDAGIEVIAVGNGEAAVRKMSEVLPDLVLADIFMPVRNGYELCEFVKHDPRYTNTPVLLLAGAFDPFDEQEAQRVQADGVLKKPFVPPDPLINAVRALLAKSAGDRLMATTAAATAAAEAAKANGSTAAAVSEPAAVEPDEADAEEFAPLSVVDFSITKGKSGFTPAMETPVAELDEPEPVVTASRDPILGEPAFWVPDEEPEEPQQATKDLTDHTWNSSRPVPLRDDPPMVGELELAPKSPSEAPAFPELVPQERVPDVTAPAAASLASLASVAEVKLDFADVSAAETASSPNPWGRPAPLEFAPVESSLPSQAESAPLATATEAPTVPAPHDVAPAVEAEAEQATREVEEIPTLEWAKTFATFTPPAAKPIAQPELEPAQAKREEREFPTLDWAKAFTPPPAYTEAAHNSAEPAPQAAAEEQAAESEGEFAIDWPPTFVPVTSSSSSASETRTALEIVPPLARAAEETASAAVEEPELDSAPAATAASALSPDAVEAVIQRVIERLQPQIVEMVTRDILRPLVEALVHSELEK